MAKNLWDVMSEEHDPTVWAGRTPLDWYHLIREAEELRVRSGWGLANVWTYINAGYYDDARECLAEMRRLIDR